MKLHEESNAEINDYGNDLSGVESFAKHVKIETKIIDAEQVNSIVYTANKGHEDKIYLLKMRNHFDVIKSLTAFYDTAHYFHECKGNEIICVKCNRKFFCKRFLKNHKCNRKFPSKRFFKNHLKNRSKVEDKTDIVCDTVKKCNDCSRIITGKFIKEHKCGYSECNNCNKYVGKNHKCYL